MRLLVVLLVFSATFLSTRGDEITFVRVWPEWRSAESFERISEYFNGRENTGGDIIVRTHADERAGFYFLVRVANSGAARTGTRFVLQVVGPKNAEPVTTTLAADVPPKSRVFLLGLTGKDWPDPTAHPVAWKLELRTPDDHVLASAQSFLWELPAK
jgi:hypothetical protein